MVAKGCGRFSKAALTHVLYTLFLSTLLAIRGCTSLAYARVRRPKHLENNEKVPGFYDSNRQNVAEDDPDETEIPSPPSLVITERNAIPEWRARQFTAND